MSFQETIFFVPGFFPAIFALAAGLAALFFYAREASSYAKAGKGAALVFAILAGALMIHSLFGGGVVAALFCAGAALSLGPRGDRESAGILSAAAVLLAALLFRTPVAAAFAFICCEALSLERSKKGSRTASAGAVAAVLLLLYAFTAGEKGLLPALTASALFALFVWRLFDGVPDEGEGALLWVFFAKGLLLILFISRAGGHAAPLAAAAAALFFLGLSAARSCREEGYSEFSFSWTTDILFLCAAGAVLAPDTDSWILLAALLAPLGLMGSAKTGGLSVDEVKYRGPGAGSGALFLTALALLSGEIFILKVIFEGFSGGRAEAAMGLLFFGVYLICLINKGIFLAGAGRALFKGMRGFSLARLGGARESAYVLAAALILAFKGVLK